MEVQGVWRCVLPQKKRWDLSVLYIKRKQIECLGEADSSNFKRVNRRLCEFKPSQEPAILISNGGESPKLELQCGHTQSRHMTQIVDCGEHSFKVSQLAGDGCLSGLKVHPTPRSLDSLADAPFWESLTDSTKDRLIVSMPINTLRSAREALCETLFEKMSDFKSICLLSSTFLATLGAGLATALVVDIGHGGIRVTPVEEGYPQTHNSTFGRIGGAALTSQMSSLLNLDLQDAEKAKEKSAWVAQDFDAELQKLKMLDSTHGPAKEREKGFLCGELLFDVQASASACASTNASREPFAAPSETLPSLVMSSLRLQSNINLRGKLLENIILFGGTAQLPGLQPRFEKELRSQSQWVAPGQSLDMVKVCEVNTTSPHGEPCSQMSLPCFGASLVAACDVMKELSITRTAYQSFGCQVVHHMFL